MGESLYGGGDIGRYAAIEAGLVNAPGIAHNRHCASGLAALQSAAATAREVLAAMPALSPGSPGVGVHISLDVSHPVGGVVILGDRGRGDQHRGIAE